MLKASCTHLLTSVINFSFQFNIMLSTVDRKLKPSKELANIILYNNYLFTNIILYKQTQN